MCTLQIVQAQRGHDDRYERGRDGDYRYDKKDRDTAEMTDGTTTAETTIVAMNIVAMNIVVMTAGPDCVVVAIVLVQTGNMLIFLVAMCPLQCNTNRTLKYQL